MFFGVVREIKMTSNWLGCIILLNIAKVFMESLAYRRDSTERLIASPLQILLRKAGETGKQLTEGGCLL